MFSILDNSAAFLRALGDAEKQVGFARTVALTRTARATAAFLGEETRRVFDRPTPFTQKAITWLWATADKQALDVFVRYSAAGGTAAEKYLKAEILGGGRRQKRSEVALSRIGVHAGFWVPGPGIKLDAYGNVPGSTIRRILSAVKADGEVGYLANRTARSSRRNKRYRNERYFVPPPTSRLHPGVWVERGRGRIAPVLLFIEAPRYGMRFDFFGTGMKFATARYPLELEQALREGWHLPRSVQKSLGRA